MQVFLEPGVARLTSRDAAIEHVNASSRPASLRTLADRSVSSLVSTFSRRAEDLGQGIECPRQAADVPAGPLCGPVRGFPPLG